MSVLHILETLGEFIIPICFAATACIFIRTIWMNRGKGISWEHDEDHNPSVNFNGVPMINGSFDSMGDSYGNTNSHH